MNKDPLQTVLKLALRLDANVCLALGVLQYCFYYVVGKWDSERMQFVAMPDAEYGSLIFGVLLLGALCTAALLIG